MTFIQNKIRQPVREMLAAFPRQVRDYLPLYGAGSVVLILIGLLNVYLQQNTAIEVTEMFEDPVAFAGLPLYIGIYTYVVGTMLIVAGAILIFAAWSAPKLQAAMKTFAIALGLLLLWFGLDDVFMIHEWVGLRLAWLLGSDDAGYDRQWLEAPVYVAYAVAWLALLIAYSRQILRTAWILLLLTFIAFGVSVVMDLWQFIPFMPQPTTRLQRLVTEVGEEMAKFAGSIFALTYALNVSHKAVQGAFAAHDDVVMESQDT